MGFASEFPAAGVGTWSDVDQAFEYWAKRLSARLRELRTGG